VTSVDTGAGRSAFADVTRSVTQTGCRWCCDMTSRVCAAWLAEADQRAVSVVGENRRSVRNRAG
jgi:hypothetical protein